MTDTNNPHETIHHYHCTVEPGDAIEVSITVDPEDDNSACVCIEPGDDRVILGSADRVNLAMRLLRSVTDDEIVEADERIEFAGVHSIHIAARRCAEIPKEIKPLPFTASKNVAGAFDRGDYLEVDLPGEDEAVIAHCGAGAKHALAKFDEGVFVGYSIVVNGCTMLLSTSTPVTLASDR